MKRSLDRRPRRQRVLLPASRLALAAFLIAPVIAAQPAAAAKQAVVSIQGMQCPFCAYGIKKHLAKLPGVKTVDVELAKNQAIVTFRPGAAVSDEDIQRAIRKAGFTPGRIEWRSVAR